MRDNNFNNQLLRFKMKKNAFYKSSIFIFLSFLFTLYGCTLTNKSATNIKLPILFSGIAPIPAERNTTWPRIHSWPVTSPAIAFPTKAASMASLSIPASVSVGSNASRPNAFSPMSMCLPNRVIPTPATTARSIGSSSVGTLDGSAKPVAD